MLDKDSVLNEKNVCGNPVHRETDEKYGFADRAGQMVVRPLYDGAMNFENGKAQVCKGCKTECVSACEYHAFTGGEWFEIDTKGTIISRVRHEK